MMLANAEFFGSIRNFISFSMFNVLKKANFCYFDEDLSDQEFVKFCTSLQFFMEQTFSDKKMYPDEARELFKNWSNVITDLFHTYNS